MLRATRMPLPLLGTFGPNWQNSHQVKRTDLFQLSRIAPRIHIFASTNEAITVGLTIGTTSEKKAPTSFEIGAFNFNPAASYSSIRQLYRSTGAGGLNAGVNFLPTNNKRSAPGTPTQIKSPNFERGWGSFFSLIVAIVPL